MYSFLFFTNYDPVVLSSKNQQPSNTTWIPRTIWCFKMGLIIDIYGFDWDQTEIYFYCNELASSAMIFRSLELDISQSNVTLVTILDKEFFHSSIFRRAHPVSIIKSVIQRMFLFTWWSGFWFYEGTYGNIAIQRIYLVFLVHQLRFCRYIHRGLTN